MGRSGGRNAGVITINLNAGTAQFIRDMDAGAASVKHFGHESVSSMQASSAAIRAFEGASNIRAVERFMGSVLGMGPALQAIFPIVGAVAFTGILVEMSEKAYEFYKGMRDVGEKTTGVFRGMLAPLRTANDELAVANDRLQIDIDKLSGHHENTLKLTLDEARVAADKLADSLDKDLDALYKVLKETEVGKFRSFFTGEAATTDLAKMIGGESGYGKFRSEVADINRQGGEDISIASKLPIRNEKEVAAAKAALTQAQRTRDQRLSAAYKRLEDGLQAELSSLTVEKKPQGFDQNKPQFGLQRQGGEQRVIDLTGMVQAVRAGSSAIVGRATSRDLTERDEALKAAAANRAMDRPFESRMKLMGAQIDALKAKYEAIGKPEAAQVLAKAFGAAQKAIEETDKALARRNVHLTEGQKEQIRASELTIAQSEAESAWKSKIEGSATATELRIKELDLLTAAIGKGYEATRKANIETRVLQELGEHAFDPAWLRKHPADVERIRSNAGQQFDAQRRQDAAQAIDRISDQIEMEKALAAAQREGAEAVRQAAFAVKLRQMVTQGATREQIAAEMELHNAQSANLSAEMLDKLEQRVDATRRLTAAISGGAEAERRAGLESKYGEMRRNLPGGGSQIPGVLGISKEEAAARQADALDNQQKLAQAGFRVGAQYVEQVRALDQQIAALQAIRKEAEDKLHIDLAIRDLNNQRLHALAQESLQMRGLRDGVRAFFIDMQTDAKSAASIVYDALHSAVDRVSTELTKVLTGQKASWAEMFHSIGDQILQQTIKSQIQKGLGALGKTFGLDIAGANKPDGSSPARALWVRMAGGSGSAGKATDALSGVGGKIDLGGLFGGGDKGGGIFSFLGRLFGGKGATESVSSSISFPEFGGGRAWGGSVGAGVAYDVGEFGRERFVPQTSGTIVPNHKLGGDTHYHSYDVDARGAELGVETRVASAIAQSHKMAVSRSVQATVERGRRVPRGV